MLYSRRPASVPAPPLGTSVVRRIADPGRGLYDPRYEHDACGVALVAAWTTAHARGRRQGAARVEHLEHRGATGADPRTGDGAGILVQLPDAFFREVVDFELPPAGQYGVGGLLPADDDERSRASSEELIELNVRVEGQQVLGWRDVPVDAEHVGTTANRTRPHMRQVFVGAVRAARRPGRLRAQALRHPAHRRAAAARTLYVASFSTRTIVYKGMLIPEQLRGFFPDLQHPSDGERDGARALALLDEHVPELAARRTRTASSPTTARSTR